MRTGVRRGILLLAAALLAVMGQAHGGEEDLYAQLLSRYEKSNSELQHLLQEFDCPSRVPEYPARVLSLRRNAGVTIGGEMRVDYIGSRGSFIEAMPGDPQAGPRTRSRSKLGSLQLATANLDIEFRAGRWRAYFDINLQGYHGVNRISSNTNPNAPGEANPTSAYHRSRPIDNIDAAYIEMLKDGHSGFGFKAGIMELPFGLSSRPDLIGKSFMDAPDLTGSYLMSPASWDNSVRLPHPSRFLDPAVAALISYEMRDIVRFEAAVFQERGDRREYSSMTDGGVSRSRSDSAPPRSWQVGVSLLPLEGWELSMHFRNRYSRSRGVRYWADSPSRWDFRRNMASGKSDPRWDPDAGQWSDSGTGESFGSRRNEQAFILGLALEIPNTNWAVQAEYAVGWNQGFNKHLSSEGINLGLSYRVTPFLTLHAQGEWLYLKDRSWMARTAGGSWARDRRDNRLYRALLGAEYELVRNLTLEAGWQYEYWNLTSGMGGADGTRDERVNTANMVYMGTRFIF